MYILLTDIKWITWESCRQRPTRGRYSSAFWITKATRPAHQPFCLSGLTERKNRKNLNLCGRVPYEPDRRQRPKPNIQMADIRRISRFSTLWRCRHFSCVFKSYRHNCSSAWLCGWKLSLFVQLNICLLINCVCVCVPQHEIETN